MRTFHVNLFVCANFVATVFAYYKKCYDEFSVCLITNAYDPYRQNKNRLSQLSADYWCKTYSSSLAIITNETVQSAITAFIGDSLSNFDSDVITYAYRVNQSTWSWTDNTRADISVISSYYGYGFLIQTVSGGNLFALDRQATSKRNFICSYLIYSSSCPDGHQQLGMRCYKIHRKKVTWFDARNICLEEEGSDLATFEDGIPSLRHNSELQHREEYWIGLLGERWIWRNNGSFVDFKYSNWDDEQPSDSGGDCLCLKARTGKWTTCDCSQKNRFICLQDYASDSASTVRTSTTTMITRPSKMTTPTTKRTTATTKTTTATTKTTLKTTQSTTTDIPTVGDSSSQFHSTPTLTLYDNSRSKMSDNPPDTLDSWKSSDSQRLIIWVPLALLIVVIAMVVSRIVIGKLRKRNRLAKQGASSTTNTCQPASSADTYATRKPAENSIEDRTYAELTLYETIEDEKRKTSK